VTGRALRLLVWSCAFVGFLIWTNPGVGERIGILIEEGKVLGLAAFLTLWTICIGALVAVAFSPRWPVRLFWVLVFAISGGVGLVFFRIGGSDFSIFDAVSLWSARHEGGRAFAFYQSYIIEGVVAAVLAILLFTLTPYRWRPQFLRSRYVALVPLVPVLLIAGMIYSRDGYGNRGLPTQISPVAVGVLTGHLLANSTLPERRKVEWRAETPLARKVVLIVDESVRADFLDWQPGNPYTPELARLKDRFVDFGPAASGANCSSYANAILRFGATRHDLSNSIRTNAPIWQYAKAAGFKTVFIDAQAAFIKKYSDKLQNFMTPAEVADIDDFLPLDSDVPPPQLDDRLADAIIAQLKSDGPVFIYAIKNGAHFPYDQGYPESAAEFRPVMSESGSEAARVNSYRNAIKWATDRIMARIMSEADLKDTVLIYTSDHGQNLTSGKLSHCTVEDPDPREALVPLLVATGNEALRQDFQRAAELSRGHVSHFAIMPTILQLFGYSPAEIVANRGPTLFDGKKEDIAFTSGDVFGLFSRTVRWNRIDPLTDHEPLPVATSRSKLNN